MGASLPHHGSSAGPHTGGPRSTPGPGRARPETLTPGERARIPARRLALAYALAVALPLASAAALIPLRASHGRALAIVLVLPVVAVAALGATGPALVSALSAGAGYAVLLTPPYYRFAFDQPDDRVAALILVAVGMAVGVLNSLLVGARTGNAVRRSELEHLLRFASEVTGPRSSEHLTASACQHLSAVLHLSRCEWEPGPRTATGGPVLLPTGGIMGYLKDLNPDRAQLPPGLELPAASGGHEVGRFVLTPEPGQVVSYEERLTAATIATMYAAAMDSSAARPDGLCR